MAANGRHPPWTDEEVETLIKRYQAGDLWRDIVPAVSAASGNPRTKDGCRKKAGDLLLTADRPRDYNRVVIDKGDIEDMIVLDYSRSRAAKELGCCEQALFRNLKTQDEKLRAAWRKRARKRQRRGLKQRHKEKRA